MILKKTILALAVIFLFCNALVIADTIISDSTSQFNADVNMLSQDIYNASDVNTTNLKLTGALLWDGVTATGNLTVIGDINASGNITTNTNFCIGALCIPSWDDVNKTYTTTDWYLGVSGLTLTFDQTKLNATIQDLSDIDTDTFVTSSNISGWGYFNTEFNLTSLLDDNYVAASAYTNLLYENGTNPLTANWAQGSFNFTDTTSWFLGKIPYANVQNHPADQNNYTNALSVSTSDLTKTINLQRAGIASNLTASFTDNNTLYTAGGILLDLTGTTFSIREGTLTDEYVCIYQSTGTQIECTKDIDASGTCTGALCGGGHTHPANEVTAGSFGTGNYTFDTAVTMEKILLEGNLTGHSIYNNATCIIIQAGSTTLEICS